MNALRGKRAVVTGGTSGIGKATVKALVAKGAQVTVVSRRDASADTIRGDVTSAEVAAKVMREVKPDLLVLSAGVTPTMGRFDELDWASFSEAWNVDLQATFHFLKQALSMPRGSAVVVVSSGAALNGSPFSGGYAGAKRMQWWLADYAQRVSTERDLGVRFSTVVPEQLVTGTTIGITAATAYGAMAGMTAEAFMQQRYEVQLDVDMVASAIVKALEGEASSVGVKGTGLRALP